MKKKTIILTFAQVNHLLNNLPKGYQIRASAKDLNTIIDQAKNKSK
ncbi:MAG: hypothetical protein Q8M29_08765 [Bacteroidota bacterium]|nr:hypothetical protein [Bacteroidota bacterium]